MIIRLLIGVTIFLWATPIGPEVLPEFRDIKNDSKVSFNPPKASQTKDLGLLNRKQLQVKDYQQVDQQVFQREFKRQAFASELYDCLKQSQPSPQSVLYELVLSKSGLVLRVQESGKPQRLAQCAEEKILNMTFEQTAQGITGETHTIIWRVDW